MCELFAVSSESKGTWNEYLKEFYGHSSAHPHGWGLAVLEKNEVNIEKEPMQASHSYYLHERMTVPIEGKVLLSHIRYATIGNLKYENCHPFTGKDISGRRWTLMHNGTIFSCDVLSRYLKKELGDTDSERIFLYILDRMNAKIREVGELSSEARFQLLEEIIRELAKGNKLNLLFYDGEYLYVHTNQEGTLYYQEDEDRIIFATVPLSNEEWKPVPMTTLLSFRDGKRIYEGKSHGNVYVPDQKSIDELYRIFSHL